MIFDETISKKKAGPLCSERPVLENIITLLINKPSAQDMIRQLRLI
jgi:hypothetical protein